METTFYSQKCSNARNGVYMFESKWHVLVNVTIMWWYMYHGAHAFRAQISLCYRPRSEMDVSKIQSICMIALQPIQQTLKNVLRRWEGRGVLQHPPYCPDCLFYVHSVRHNKTIKLRFKTRVVCLPPTSGFCTYTPI
jgi:hypothetical protein